MSGFLTPDARLRTLTDLGLIAAGAKLHTYVSGSPSTPLTTYNNVDLAPGHENANPIVASAGGLFGPIYLTPGVAYKFVLTDANDVTLWSQDPISVPTAGLTAPVLVTQGGTGIIVGVSGGILYFSGTTAMASSALLAAHGLVVGGGAGSAPTSLAVGASGTVLAGNTGADPGFVSLGVQDRQVTLQTVVNSVAETTVYTYAVPANLLGTTRKLRLSLIGDHKNNTGGTDSVRVRVKYGATVIFDGTIAAVNQGANRGALMLEVELAAANATNAQRAKGRLSVGDSTQNNAGGVAASLAGLNSYMVYGVHNNVAEDSTAIKNLVVTFQMGTADANIDMRAHVIDTEII